MPQNKKCPTYLPSTTDTRPLVCCKSCVEIDLNNEDCVKCVTDYEDAKLARPENAWSVTEWNLYRPCIGIISDGITPLLYTGLFVGTLLFLCFVCSIRPICAYFVPW